ncbi:unnamed protein product [Owenia fusiformis]|uniref:Aminopeptidase N n=1 Tax=Owenia fusiformis TaxID=6347 RepID=A0A8S4P9M4_OWEFU|nr:unnamed protein product [Owenia fusiformis]
MRGDSQQGLNYYVDKDGNGGSGGNSGCYITTVTGFILVLLAIAIAVGVGLIVFFASPSKEQKCICEYPEIPDTGTTAPLTWESVCKNLTDAGKDSCTMGLPCPNGPDVGGTATTTTTTTAPTTKPTVDVRLPTNLHPHHYKVELYPDMYKQNPEDFEFTGSVEILLECKEPTDEVIFHIKALTIDDASIEFSEANGAADGPKKQGQFEEDEERQFFIQKLDKPMVKGKNYTIKMTFRAPLTKGLAGLYLSSYEEGGVTKYLATTQFQPTDTRRAFPCFDEPGVKSTFDITLVRKEAMVSLSNMEIKQTENRAGGLKADVYQTTVIMPTYLLAFVVCDFDKSEGVTTSGTKFRVWSRKEAVNQTRYALGTGIAILEYFEDYFDVDFPLPKQDMIAVPDFAAGAMENWGLIIYRETALLYDNTGSSASNKQRVAVVVSHELAHQWFGNLVTPGWWDDLWLNEGFASYVEYLGVDFVHPEWKMMEQFVVEDLEDVFKLDGLASSHPVYVPVGHPDEINEIFDRISYAKGASIIRMMNNFLTEGTFRKGLANYLRDNAYGNTHHTDLWNSLTDQATSEGKDINVGEIMNTWVRQMGYPVVTVSRNGASAEAVQKHYLLDPSQTPDSKYPSAYNYIWKIPLSFTTKSESNFTDPPMIWMNEETKSLNELTTDTNDWLLVNVNQMGYYRVDYDTTNWNALISQLKDNHTAIQGRNRAQLIDDAFSLSRAGIHNVDITMAMQTTNYLINEREYIPWWAAIENLRYITQMLGSTGSYGDYNKYILEQILPLYDFVGWNDSLTNDPHLEQFTRSLAISQACARGYQECKDQASELYKEWMDSPDDNKISPNLKGTVYCNAIANGGIEEWDFAFERFQNENLAGERVRLLQGMACSTQPWILSRYLSWSIDERYIRKQDAVAVLVYISRNRIGLPLVWDFVRAQWNYIFDEYGKGAFSFTNLINGITETFNTDFQLQEVKSFMDAKAAINKLGSGQRAFEQVLEKTTSNIKWMENNYDKLKIWLQNSTGPDFGGTTTAPTTKPNIDVRLPTNLHPHHYKVELYPDMYKQNPEDFEFTGSVEILLECKEPTDEVVFHIKALTIDDASIEFSEASGAADAPKKQGQFEEDEERQFFIQKLDKPMVKGNNYTIKMAFRAPLTKGLAGLYLSSYEEGGVTKYLATTQFQPTDTRRAFPCFDEPGVKSTFDITLVRKEPMVSLSNMEIKQTVDRAGGLKADVYQTTVIMPTYLLAFVVCDFDKSEGVTASGTKFRVWSRKEAVNQTRYALDTGIAILEHFEDYFDVDFPLPKQDMIAVPDFAAGAMENWGLIIYRETALLYDNTGSSAANKQRVAVVVSHELAHQWFGNLVTPGWWDDLWLNEGFASYVEYLGVDFVHPEWKMMEQFVVEDLEDVFKLDGLASSHPLYVPVGHPDEINEIFDRISYAKGASIIRMMNNFLTEDTFRNGLANYLKDNAYGNTHHTDLWNSLTDQATSEGKDIDVGEIMNTWVRQMGYPVVTVSRNGASAEAVQKHYLLDPSQTPDPKYPSAYNYIWKIPLSFTTKSESNFTDPPMIWMNEETKSLNGLPTDTNDWVLVNVNQMGYYRVDYDTTNWNALIGQLNVSHTAIQGRNRAQLIDDAFSLSRAGIHNVDITMAMQTTNYLINEREYIPWWTAIENLRYITRMLGSTGSYGDYNKYILKQILPLYDFVGWNDSLTNDPHLEQFTRSLAISQACARGYQECKDQASALYKEWMDSPDDNKISPNLKGTVYCNAIANGGIEEWDFAFERFQNENLAGERVRLLQGMACSTQPWILSRYLSWSIDERYIRKQDAVAVLVYISRNRIGLPLVWNFVRAQWDYIFDEYGRGFFSFTSLINGITETFNTEFQLQEVKSFMDAKAAINKLGSGQRAFEQVLEKTSSNIKWMENNYDKLGTWLQENS